MTKICLNWISMAIVSVVALVSCGPTPNAHDAVSSADSETPLRTDSSNDQENSQNSQTPGVSSAAIDAPILAILDDRLPVAYIDNYEILYEDIEALTNEAEVIFIGRVVGYKERLYTVPPSPDILAVAKPNWEIVDIVEGIVLEADEVLLGEMPEPDSRITLGVLALQETLDGTSKSRILSREISLFSGGIENIGSNDSPKYLVYAGPSGSTKAKELGLYWIRTRSGVVRVGDDGSLTGARGMPFSEEMWLRDDEGNFDWRPAHDLQDARDAAELAKSGIEDTSGVPEEQSTGIEEAPVDQPVEGSDQGVPVEAPASEPGDVSAGDGSGDLAGVDSRDETSEQTDDAKNGELGDAPDVDDGSEASDGGEGSAPGTSGDVSDQGVPVEAPASKPGDVGDASGDLAGADSSDDAESGDSGDAQDVGDDSAGVVPEGDGNAAEQSESSEDGEGAVPGTDDALGDTDNGDNADDIQDAQESPALGS